LYPLNIYLFGLLHIKENKCEIKQETLLIHYFLTYVLLKLGVLPAQLGLKALALAWPGGALAYKFFRPGHEPKPGQSQSLAFTQAQLRIEEVECNR
jgi:hypothetical protein